MSSEWDRVSSSTYFYLLTCFYHTVSHKHKGRNFITVNETEMNVESFLKTLKIYICMYIYICI